MVTGIAIRLVIAPFFAHPFDVFSWYEVGNGLLSGQRSFWQFLTPYQYSYFIFVFPATVFANFLSHYLPSFTIQTATLNPVLLPQMPPGISVVPGLVFDFAVKLALIASDTLVALLIYKLVAKYSGNKSQAILATTLWFLDPLTIWVSSGWGTFDTLPALFTVIALYFVLERKFEFAGIALTLSIMMKYYAIVLLIPLLLISWNQGRKLGVAKLGGSTLIASIMFLTPTLARSILGFTSLVGNISPSGFHYSGLSIFTSLSLFITNFDQNVISSIILGSILVVIYFWIWKKLPNSKDSFYSTVIFLTLPIIALLLFYQFVGEDFFIWVLPFLSILALKNRNIFRLFWAISIIALISSVVDSLLPYYLLPVSPWIGNYLIAILTKVAPYRVAPNGIISAGVSTGKVLLSLLGVIMFCLLILTTRFASSLATKNEAYEEIQIK